MDARPRNSLTTSSTPFSRAASLSSGEEREIGSSQVGIAEQRVEVAGKCSEFDWVPSGRVKTWPLTCKAETAFSSA